MSPIVCRACGTRFPMKRFSEEECQALADLHSREEAAAELVMLRKVEAFYQRHPYAEGKINPHFIDVFESDDPWVQEQMFDNVPFDQIELPDAPPVVVPRTAEDAEVIDYLRHHHFDLQARLKLFEPKPGNEPRQIPRVHCPHCQTGELFVPDDGWLEFSTAGDATTFYWPDMHEVDDDGVLHVRTTGYQDGYGGYSHWNGETAIHPADPNYTFWRWLVAQPEHHRIISGEEFEEIRTKYNRAATQGN